jgi:hypothetical protein
VAPAAQRAGDDGAPWGAALIPGLRDRLLRELDEAGIPPRRRIGRLCSITGRKSPTVRRWLDPEQPGLPDLESFARLCKSLNLSAGYLLGLAVRRAGHASTSPLDPALPWLGAVERSAALVQGCETMLMTGDDMDPLIQDGDVLFVDRRVNKLAGNGTYEVEYAGRRMVRSIEDRLAEGLALRCANERYAEVLVSPKALPRLKIVGKVVASMGMTAL